LGEAFSSVLDWRGHPQHAQLAKAFDHRPGNIGIAVDRRGVDVRVSENAHGRDGILDGLSLGRGQLRIREDDVSAEFAPEQSLRKTFPRRFGEEQLLGLLHLLGGQGLIIGSGRCAIGSESRQAAASFRSSGQIEGGQCCCSLKAADLCLPGNRRKPESLPSQYAKKAPAAIIASVTGLSAVTFFRKLTRLLSSLNGKKLHSV